MQFGNLARGSVKPPMGVGGSIVIHTESVSSPTSATSENCSIKCLLNWPNMNFCIVLSLGMSCAENISNVF